MNATCLRCGNPAFATLKIEATISETRLAVSGDGGESGICAACMVELAQWFTPGHQNGAGADCADSVGSAECAVRDDGASIEFRVASRE
jgi:hypothetical protein